VDVVVGDVVLAVESMVALASVVTKIEVAK
jgi:hypothetical protein